ncbi:suppressor of tumorigenicity 7 protein-like isoform X5 [Rhinoderma darwinii]|uniref:suppressor of tumorigenicity 7 protein-like isoform X5 n=1 Tax=Rhinoderma darwinii TaxID=43563 RepID=UPI003F661E3A
MPGWRVQYSKQQPRISLVTHKRITGLYPSKSPPNSHVLHATYPKPCSAYSPAVADRDKKKTTTNMAEPSSVGASGSSRITRVKGCLCRYWAYVCLLLFVTGFLLFYHFRAALRLYEAVVTVTGFINTLTPKFYVALTGTSSLISGLILIFEWCYFRKYGASFIEQVSVNHLRPLMGGIDPGAPGEGFFPSAGDNETSRQTLSECKVWRNPLNLFRGAEYNRYIWVTGKEPLTYYDMNLSAQDHQTFFTCASDSLRSSDAVMQKAWRERSPHSRVKAAYQALEVSNDSATAYILLAEEEATTISDAERLFQQALKAAESAYKKSQQTQHLGSQHEAQYKRDMNVLVYTKRRLAMCARKLGRVREAVKIMRDLMKEFPLLSMVNIHENLLEALLELQAYADVQAVLAKYDDISLPKSASICYTAALLKARAVSDRFSPETASRRGLSTAEMNAVEAIHRAVEFNPHVPKYLLEMKSLIMPPEHILKRGDSEAVAYAFFHLQHWKRVEGALNLLHCTWEGTFHEVSVYPKKELPFFIHFTAGLCSFTAMLALLTHQFPELMGVFAKAFFVTLLTPFTFMLEKIESIMPSSFWHQLTRM